MAWVSAAVRVSLRGADEDGETRREVMSTAPNPKPFIVPKEPVEQSVQQEEETPEPLEISGDVRADTEGALRALAFLIEFLDEVGPDELRRCADEIHASRVQQ